MEWPSAKQLNYIILYIALVHFSTLKYYPAPIIDIFHFFI
jgi:hypothetical protein